jgi:RNA-directed DNA polymerase
LNKAKSFDIPKQLVFEAYQRVAKKKGAAGIDAVTLKMFHEEHKRHLYKLWNRMSSGCYMPPPVKTVLIPKKSGGERPLGIPTVADRTAQTVVKMVLEPLIDPHFDADSYGYRPMKSALDAVAQVRERCWKYRWVIDLDIKGFFDNIDHELMLRAVEKHTSCRWTMLYVKRWLNADIQQPDGTLVKRERGTPQGGVISPLLANLFLHYAFDRWMRKHYPSVHFVRYADDIVVHCKTKVEAETILKAIEQRLAECKLAVNREKTKIVYCGLSNRYDDYPHRSFDFLGYTFRRRPTRASSGEQFVGFVPAISNTAKRDIRQVIRGWRIHLKTSETLENLAKWINPHLRGWVNYYGKFNRSEMESALLQVEYYLKRWVRRKFRGRCHIARIDRALSYLGRARKFQPHLFEHWRYGWGSPMVE